MWCKRSVNLERKMERYRMRAPTLPHVGFSQIFGTTLLRVESSDGIFASILTSCWICLHFDKEWININTMVPTPKVMEQEEEFFCRGCYFDRKSKRSTRPFKGYIQICDSSTPKEKYVSRGLTAHLNHQRFSDCKAVYQREGLEHDGIYDFATSMRRKSKKRRTALTCTPSDYGLTMTVNGPIKSTNTEDVSINAQVIHDVHQPHISREAIIAASNRNHAPNTAEDSEGERNLKNDTCDQDTGKVSDDVEDPMDVQIDVEGSFCFDDDEREDVYLGINDKGRTKRKVRASMVALRPRMKTEIELMCLLKEHKMPLTAFSSIWNWAVRSKNEHGFDFGANVGPARTRLAMFKEIGKNLGTKHGNTFKSTTIPWLPGPHQREIYFCPFEDALFSLINCQDLMVEKNLSFPNSTNPTSPIHDPELTDNSIIEQLHHGSWWRQSWIRKCTPNSNEILVPIILYMDGISLDTRGNLGLTPLNMTLGIFNIETRSKPQAWRTIYFHPEVKHELGTTSDPADKVQNLHTGIEAAMESFRKLSDHPGGVQWDYLPFAGKQWKVRMKFSVAYIVGDTEMHDRLCGRYQARGRGVKKLCRHCQCDAKDICNPSVQHRQELWRPEDFVFLPGFTKSQQKERCQMVSHHNINNVFHDLDFGANEHNIHLASPGECLHMHQLGVAKRAVESFKSQISGSIDTPYAPNFSGSGDKQHGIGTLGQMYGGLLSRQSDRDLPRTKFGSDILNDKRKEGHDFSGILICILLAIISKRGNATLGDSTFVKEQVKTIEWILSMEEFLKHGRITIGMRKKMARVINQFVKQNNKTCLRGGMGNNLIKTHLYFHLPKYIELWGPPLGWDSAPSESHHKTEIKAPSKNTQNRPSTLIQQTAMRQSELMMLNEAITTHNLGRKHEKAEAKAREGAAFRIFNKDDGSPTMEWDGNKLKPHYPQAVLKYCCQEILPLLKDTRCVHGCTEHKRYDTSVQKHFLFRSHPSFRADSGQRHSTWMDWATFLVLDNNGQEVGVPAQIMCFLKLKRGDKTPAGGVVGDTGGVYAVVRSFRAAPKPTVSNFVTRGELDGKNFELYDTETIVSELAVVPNIEEGEDEPKEWFVVQRREEWLFFFQNKLEDKNSMGRGTNERCDDTESSDEYQDDDVLLEKDNEYGNDSDSE